MQKRKYIIILIIFGCFLIFLPYILNKFIFENNYISKVSNDGWASFLGSYIGGVISGIGTMVAMYFTIRQTQKQIDESDEKDRRKIRINESNEIARLVAAYICNIEIYCDEKQKSKLKIVDLEKEKSYYEQLLEIWKHCTSEKYFYNYKTYLEKLDNLCIENDFPKIFFENHQNEKAKEIIYNEYELEIKRVINNINNKISNINNLLDTEKQKKIIGSNAFFLLEIKLRGIKCAEELWELTKKLQSKLLNDEVLKDVQKEIDNLKEAVRKFFVYYTR